MDLVTPSDKIDLYAKETPHNTAMLSIKIVIRKRETVQAESGA